MKQLMLGNQAVARGLYEAGCRVASSYPGTPSTEITEQVSLYEEVYAEWAPNEKVAMEVALGASIGGARSFCAMKHVGLNVAADPLFTAAYTGVNAGMVICVADDQGMHSSQNEQDSRHYAVSAKVPMVEPADSQECIDFVKAAYEISEQFDTPVILRTCTRVAHSQSIVETGERTELPLRLYTKDPEKYVMMPANAVGRHVFVEERMQKLAEFAETSGLNRVEMGDPKIGIVTAGICYQYVKEELDPVIETHCRVNGIRVDGGKNLFGLLGELSQRKVAQALGKECPEPVLFGEQVPVRPPVLCPGCPHRGLFYVLSKLKVMVSGDIGCYTLGALPPLGALDTTICMGASISGLHGFNQARGGDSAQKSVAVIGDSTFIHSGITGLIDITYNCGHSTVLVLDNSITGMTGHQQNPTTGLTLKNQPAPQVSIEKICEAAGVKRVRVVDPNELAALEAILKEELTAEEPSVIITRRPCALLKQVKHNPPLRVDPERCKSCKMCMKIGCPAIHMADGKAVIDDTLCVGCDLCQRMCSFGAIKTSGEVQG